MKLWQAYIAIGALLAAAVFGASALPSLSVPSVCGTTTDPGVVAACHDLAAGGHE
jgi:hypothetical protein